MRSVPVPLPDRHYDVLVGEGVTDGLAGRLEQHDRVAVLADRRVVELHGELLPAAPSLQVEGGEAVKDLERLGEVLDFCAAAGLSRRSALVVHGGGTVGDLGGLAASLFKRGLDVVQVPTTLLAQVDASVGGKTAINLAAGKNLAGTFHQPAAVFCDPRALGTLAEEEFASGLGEVGKTALIEGDASLSLLEDRMEAVMDRDPAALADVVEACVRTKARVVVSDPEERGARRALNLGHTFGHAIEHAAGYGRVPHGVAVGVGLALAAQAAERAVGAPSALTRRTTALLELAGLPSSLQQLREATGLGDVLSREALLEGLGHDKKGSVGAPEFVLARAEGDVIMGVPLEDELLDSLLA